MELNIFARTETVDIGFDGRTFGKIVVVRGRNHADVISRSNRATKKQAELIASKFAGIKIVYHVWNSNIGDFEKYSPQ